MKEITIDKRNNSITFINNGIGFSQIGVAKEILDLITNQQEEIERLNNIINELEKWLKDEIERLMTIEQSNNVIFLIGAYTEVLDKIEELKGVDKE